MPKSSLVMVTVLLAFVLATLVYVIVCAINSHGSWHAESYSVRASDIGAGIE